MRRLRALDPGARPRVRVQLLMWVLERQVCVDVGTGDAAGGAGLAGGRLDLQAIVLAHRGLAARIAARRCDAARREENALVWVLVCRLADYGLRRGAWKAGNWWSGSSRSVRLAIGNRPCCAHDLFGGASR